MYNKNEKQQQQQKLIPNECVRAQTKKESCQRFKFSQVARSGRVQVVVAQRRELVLYAWINGQPKEKSTRGTMKRNMITFGKSRDKASSVVCSSLQI